MSERVKMARKLWVEKKRTVLVTTFLLSLWYLDFQNEEQEELEVISEEGT